MNVKELIEQLKCFDPDSQVLVLNEEDEEVEIEGLMIFHSEEYEEFGAVMLEGRRKG